jgi:hypothetical protein
MTDVCRRARRYVQEPGDATGIELVDALRRAYGDEETYDLLRAVEIHSRISRRRRAISARGQRTRPQHRREPSSSEYRAAF